jgi:hypothetical protein
MIRTNTLKGLRVTTERKVRIITNTNDTYEYIEGATSNQRKKGTNYNKYNDTDEYIEGLRVTRERKVGMIANTNDTYEYIEGATSNQRKKGRNYNKYQ